MAVTAKVYSKFHTYILGATALNFASDTIKVSLHTNTYSPTQATDAFHSAAGSEVANGNGYTTGGATLASKTLTNPTGLVTMLDAADTAWSASTITARFAVIYDATPATEATRPLIAYVDFGADVQSTGGAFTIQWDPNGIWTMTVS